MMHEKIRHDGKLLAVIISHQYDRPGVHFFTPGEFSQQLAYMRRPAGEIIAPHVHNPVAREVQFTHEVLIIKRGRLRVDFYDTDRTYLESRILEAGDVVLLAGG